LALEFRGSSTMALHVQSGVEFSARNGIRVSAGGLLGLHGGEINTIRDLEVRPGGRFEGEGLIDGRQDVIASIPEFAGQGLFEPRVVNRGVVAVKSDADLTFNAGRLFINGDYVQQAGGTLKLDVFDPLGLAGVGFDQLAMSGAATLGGTLEISISSFTTVSLSTSVEILTAAGGVSGVFSSVMGPDLPNDWAWAVHYTTSSVFLTVHEEASTGGPRAYLNLWRQHAFGVEGDADLDGDDDTDGNDFLLWQRGLGSGGAQAALAGVVPEPAGPTLVAVALLLSLASSRRCRNLS
jgi:hypothetical protein